MKTNTALAIAALSTRVIELAETSVVTTKGIAASQWRTNVAHRMAEDADLDVSATTPKGKSKFVVVETETSHRTFSLQLATRKGNGQLANEGDAKVVGMFGRDLTPKPAKAPAAEPDAPELAGDGSNFDDHDEIGGDEA